MTVLPALLAASLFPTQVRVPLPGVLRIAVVGRNLVAASADGKGTVLEGDGKPDLVIAHHERKYLTVHLGPSYAPVQVPVELTPHTHFATAADLDGDGKADLAVAAKDEVIIFLTR